MTESSNKGFRASAALASIKEFHNESGSQQSRNTGLQSGLKLVNSSSLSSKEILIIEEENDSSLKIENERLKTTLMILNQKMKVHEDNCHLSEKWKT